MIPYFTLNNEIFYRKLDVFSTTKKQSDFYKIKYHFYDDIIKNSYWWKEPSESFDELMRRRIFDLKDRYSKIRLFFSGGYDSYIVLLYFIKNNVHLDEIVHMTTDFTQTDDWASDVEYYQLFSLILQKYKKELSNTKISVWRTNFSQIMNTKAAEYINETADNLSQAWGTILAANFYHKDNLLSGHLNLWGNPSPTIMLSIDNKFYYSMNGDNNYQGNYTNFNHEFFFISDYDCNLFLKMIHMLKNYFLENNIKKSASTKDDLVKALKIPYFNDWQASNLGKVYFTNDPKKLFYPFYKGKNYLRFKAAAKHEHTKDFKHMFNDFYIHHMKDKKSFLLNTQRTGLRPIYSDYYNLDYCEIIDNIKPYPMINQSEHFANEFLLNNIYR